MRRRQELERFGVGVYLGVGAKASCWFGPVGGGKEHAGDWIVLGCASAQG